MLARPSLAAITVHYDAGTDLRQIAKTYLGDADLWPSILKASGIDRVTDLMPGQGLTVPTTEVAAARSALDSSNARIQDANAAGAQVFAFDEIDKAIRMHDDALTEQKAGDWSKTLELAVAAEGLASKAYSLAEKNRDQAAEARLSDRQGWVEGLRPEELGWEDREINAVLIEEEKVRTLSRSTAQITFRDTGRLRLNANSHAVIQRMRVDPLKKREDAKVSLVEGDFYALLGGDSDRKTLQVDVPDVNAQIDSGDFWVRHDVSGAKFTNYDDRRVEIAARGGRVDLGRNEGVVIRSGEAPRKKVELLRTPDLLAPADDGEVYNRMADLSWSPVKDAAGYWLEVARDPNFNHMVDSISALPDTSFTLKNLDTGIYYWRISALDQFGLPGPRSLSHRFDMRIDNAPPYLRLDAPLSSDIYREASVEVKGESEPGADVSVNGTPAEVDDQGRYSLAVSLKPGSNVLTVLSRDAAGNETKVSREVVHMPDATAEITFNTVLPRISARHFVANGSEISLSGRTEKNAKLQVLGPDGGIRTSAATDGDGVFAFTLPLSADASDFQINVTSASGFSTRDSFMVSIDRDPPAIDLDTPLPRLTSTEFLALRGTVTDSRTVQLNGRDIPLRDTLFDEVITLMEGENTIEMSASDLAGNVTVETWTVMLDQSPPSYVSHTIKPGSGGRVTVEVKAEDASGLAKAAPFTLLSNGTQVDGFLRYNKLSKSYRGAVAVASADISGVRLAGIELQDDAGNRIRVRLK
ncbi:FecR domain-containing protein [uncultured Roseibium sp.]|uniref:FecR domain-containing protein n=1 Tax=uncultured Roseibium sp. TaxID=1936171 RepID=UPI0032168496